MNVCFFWLSGWALQQKNAPWVKACAEIDLYTLHFILYSHMILFMNTMKGISLCSNSVDTLIFRLLLNISSPYALALYPQFTQNVTYIYHLKIFDKIMTDINILVHDLLEHFMSPEIFLRRNLHWKRFSDCGFMG